jgi:hypothetical protein
VLPQINRSDEQRVCDRCFAHATIGRITAIGRCRMLDDP